MAGWCSDVQYVVIFIDGGEALWSSPVAAEYRPEYRCFSQVLIVGLVTYSCMQLHTLESSTPDTLSCGLDVK